MTGDVDFRWTGQMAVGAALFELVMGGILFGLGPEAPLMVALPLLAILFGTIVLLCVVAIPRPVRLSLIAGLAILFVLMGSRVTLMGAAIQNVPVERADAPADAPMTRRTDNRPASVTGGGGGAAGGTGGGGTGSRGAWMADIGAVLADVGQGDGARISIDAVRVNDGAQPPQVGIDWSVEAAGGRLTCASLTIAAADRQAALDAIAAVLGAALARSRATGRPLCY